MNSKFNDRLGAEYREVLSVIKVLQNKQTLLLISPNPNSALVKENTIRLSALIDKLFVINSSRHQTMGSDVEFINHLEYEYLKSGDSYNLLKVLNIEIFQDYILIAGIRLSRRNEINTFSSLGTLYLPDTNTMYFTLEGALSYIKASEGIGIPTDEDWGNIIKAIPGNTQEEISNNLKGILNLTFTGICKWKEGNGRPEIGVILEGHDTFGAYRSGSSVLNKKIRLFYFENAINTVGFGHFTNSQIALRCKLL